MKSLVKVVDKSDLLNESKFINVLRFIAILSVVSAHSASVPSNSGIVISRISLILHSFGSLGVPIFFIISGYLYYNDNKNFSNFFQNKIVKIVIPWFFCETIVWLYVVIRKGGINLSSWFNFVLGFNHSTYYLTVLMFMFIVFFKFKKDIVFNLFSIVLSIVSIVLTINNINPIDSLLGSPYINPLAWMLYFSIGLLMNRYNMMSIVVSKMERYFILLLSILLLSLFVHLKNNLSFSYWSSFTFINTFAAISVSFVIAKRLSLKQISSIQYVGSISFTIYLLHELVVGFVVLVTSKLQIWLLIAIRPIIVILIVCMGVWVYSSIVSKLIKKDRLLNLIGIKTTGVIR